MQGEQADRRPTYTHSHTGTGRPTTTRSPASTHRLGQRVLVGACGDVQGAGGLVVAQPAPARALSSFVGHRGGGRFGSPRPKRNSASNGGVASRPSGLVRVWVPAAGCCWRQGPHSFLPTCTAAVLVLNSPMNLSRLPHLDSMPLSSSPLGGRQSCRTFAAGGCGASATRGRGSPWRAAVSSASLKAMAVCSVSSLSTEWQFAPSRALGWSRICRG